MLFITYQLVKPRKTLLYLIAGFFIALAFILYRKTGTTDVPAWLATTGILLFVCFYYALSKTKVLIDNNGITFDYLFKKQVTFGWADIIASRMTSHYHGHAATLEWEFISADRKKAINPSFYSRKNLRLIAEALTGKCPHATIDSRIIKIAEGRFPWYIF